jgi:hypothetical protein
MAYFVSERLEITTWRTYEISRSNYNNRLIIISCHVGMKCIVLICCSDVHMKLYNTEDAEWFQVRITFTRFGSWIVRSREGRFRSQKLILRNKLRMKCKIRKPLKCNP